MNLTLIWIGGAEMTEEYKEGYQERTQELKELKKDLTQDKLWEAIKVFEGCPFSTVKGLEFKYTVKGNELFIDRKEKSITRSSVNIALEKVILYKGEVTGPKKLGVFGASYLYPVFIRLGLIKDYSTSSV